jgi:hypothetical protein
MWCRSKRGRRGRPFDVRVKLDPQSSVANRHGTQTHGIQLRQSLVRYAPVDPHDCRLTVLNLLQGMELGEEVSGSKISQGIDRQLGLLSRPVRSEINLSPRSTEEGGHDHSPRPENCPVRIPGP